MTRRKRSIDARKSAGRTGAAVGVAQSAPEREDVGPAVSARRAERRVASAPDERRPRRRRRRAGSPPGRRRPGSSACTESYAYAARVAASRSGRRAEGCCEEEQSQRAAAVAGLRRDRGGPYRAAGDRRRRRRCFPTSMVSSTRGASMGPRGRRCPRSPPATHTPSEPTATAVGSLAGRGPSMTPRWSRGSIRVTRSVMAVDRPTRRARRRRRRSARCRR